MKILAVIALGLWMFYSPLLPASETEDADEAWLNDDSEFQSLDVNEGELKFIAPIKNKAVLFSDTELMITEDSLKTGWVNMQQCYHNLDPVGQLDIVYQYKNIKKLDIISSQGIEKAVLSGQRVSLKNLTSPAILCVKALVQNLSKAEKGFVLTNGPYHRQFLDGYYPYHIRLRIDYPSHKLALIHFLPQQQALFNPQHTDGRFIIDTWFEGNLIIKLEFE